MDGKQRRERVLFLVSGILFILVSMLAVYNAISAGKPEETLWFCYIGMFLIGWGILSRNATLVASQLFILFIPDIIWSLDFVVHLIRGQSWLGITDYFFLEGRPFLMNLVTLQHLFTVPLALYFFSHLKADNRDVWVLSFFQVSILYILTLSFTSPEDNVNCAYRFCGNFSPPYNYGIWWFGIFFLMTFASSWITSRILGLKRRS